MGRTPNWKLSQREKEILTARFKPVIDEPGYGNPVSYGIIAKKYGVDHERIRQIIGKAITKLIYANWIEITVDKQ
jgi:DNA-directed RNA polymerase sigma subunit (sigma70/sigma32)